MNPSELYQVWAPEGAPWSPWAKPVLFAVESSPSGNARDEWEAAQTQARTRWTPPEPGGMALVLDLPGALALALSLDCARRGWRPVPLFNSCPGPNALVDNEPIRAGLIHGAALLQEMTLYEASPPAFVLDSRRTEKQPAPGQFDNRWVVFAQDFPSAARLLSSRVRRVLLVQEGRLDPKPDLAHVLLRWQRAGLEILAVDLAAGTSPVSLAVAQPSRFRAIGYRVLVALGLRRNSAGGFGGIVPMPSPSGGGGWA